MNKYAALLCSSLFDIHWMRKFGSIEDYKNHKIISKKVKTLREYETQFQKKKYAEP